MKEQQTSVWWKIVFDVSPDQKEKAASVLFGNLGRDIHHKMSIDQMSDDLCRVTFRCKEEVKDLLLVRLLQALGKVQGYEGLYVVKDRKAVALAPVIEARDAPGAFAWPMLEEPPPPRLPEPLPVLQQPAPVPSLPPKGMLSSAFRVWQEFRGIKEVKIEDIQKFVTDGMGYATNTTSGLMTNLKNHNFVKATSMGVYEFFASPRAPDGGLIVVPEHEAVPVPRKRRALPVETRFGVMQEGMWKLWSHFKGKGEVTMIRVNKYAVETLHYAPNAASGICSKLREIGLSTRVSDGVWEFHVEKLENPQPSKYANKRLRLVKENNEASG